MSNFDPLSQVLRPTSDTLAQRLASQFDVVQQELTLGGRTFQLQHPRSADDLISEEDFNRDERLPYWAEIWPSAYVLSKQIAMEPGKTRDQKQRRLLELGCGCGLAVIAALSAGFEVTAIDYYPEALEFVRLNALSNEIPPPETRIVDWRQYPTDLAGFDVVVAADVLYERDYCRLVATALRQSLALHGVGFVTDPQRVKAEPFPEECRRAGLQISAAQVFGPLSVPGGDPRVRQTINLFEIQHQI